LTIIADGYPDVLDIPKMKEIAARPDFPRG